jgi:hypothetical protein
MNDYVVVTAISSHRMRYVMHKDDLRKMNTDAQPTDKELLTWAMDSVTMQECEEFSQMHIGEQIIDALEMNEEEILNLFDADNDYLSEWDRGYKLQWIRRNLVKDEPQEPYHSYISRMYKEMEKEHAEQDQ